MNEFYKQHYIIVFYDKTDENLLYMFDNVKEILKFKGECATNKNLARIRRELYYALRTENHFVRFLTGEVMRVYIIDIEEENINETI